VALSIVVRAQLQAATIAAKHPRPEMSYQEFQHGAVSGHTICPQHGGIPSTGEGASSARNLSYTQPGIGRSPSLAEPHPIARESVQPAASFGEQRLNAQRSSWGCAPSVQSAPCEQRQQASTQGCPETQRHAYTPFSGAQARGLRRPCSDVAGSDSAPGHQQRLTVPAGSSPPIFQSAPWTYSGYSDVIGNRAGLPASNAQLLQQAPAAAFRPSRSTAAAVPLGAAAGMCSTGVSPPPSGQPSARKCEPAEKHAAMATEANHVREAKPTSPTGPLGLLAHCTDSPAPRGAGMPQGRRPDVAAWQAAHAHHPGVPPQQPAPAPHKGQLGCVSGRAVPTGPPAQLRSSPPRLGSCASAHRVEDTSGGAPLRVSPHGTAAPGASPHGAFASGASAPGSRRDSPSAAQRLGASPPAAQRVGTLSPSKAASGNATVPLDPLHVRRWVYPTNKPVRDYQLRIAEAGLFDNTLVCLPTGLGKTLIAAVIMANFHRCSPCAPCMLYLAASSARHACCNKARRGMFCTGGSRRARLCLWRRRGRWWTSRQARAPASPASRHAAPRSSLATPWSRPRGAPHGTLRASSSARHRCARHQGQRAMHAQALQPPAPPCHA
jgi:hypothetical protein